MSRQGKNIYLASAVIMAMLPHSGLIAQQKGIDTIQVNVVTRYKPTIHDAVKIDSNPATADTIHISRKVKYNFVNTQYPTFYTPPSIPALQIKGEPVEPLFHSLLEAGVGNYNTLYGEYFFNSVRSQNTDYGFHLNHLSSEYTTNNYGYSGYAFNNIDGYLQKFYNQSTLTLNAGFENHVVHDYGYNITEFPSVSDDETRVGYNLYKGSLEYASAYRDSSKINHDIRLSYYNFGENDYSSYDPSENNVNADMRFFTYFNQQRIDLRIKGEYDDYTYNTPDFDGLGPFAPTSAQTENILFNPFFSTKEKYWDAHLGINLFAYSSSGGAGSSSEGNMYPDLLVRYHIAQDVVMIYAGIDGNETLNTYKSLTDKNPFTDPYLPLNYTYTQYHLYGGLTGSITSQLTYNADVAQSMIKNMPLFVTDTLAPLKNRFTVVYDNVKVFNIHGDLDYKWDNNLGIILAGDYNIYTSTYQLKAWYNPTLKISATGRYTIQNKYTLKAELFYVGSQYAPETVDGVTTAKTLSGYLDLNLGVDYKCNKAFTAFLNLNNIANVAYYTWDNYEMERFNFLIGIRFGF